LELEVTAKSDQNYGLFSEMQTYKYTK